MGNTQTIHEQTQQENQHTDKQTQNGDTPKRDLIIKDKTLSIKLHNTHIEVSNGLLSQIYGRRKIKHLYLHKDIALSISDCYEIAKHIKIFFIDANGNIVAKYKRSKVV